MRIALALIGLALVRSAPAEDLIEVYDLAVESDPVLRAVEQNLLATREVKPQARALLLPNFGVEGTYDYLTTEDIDGDRRSLTAAIGQSIYNRANWMQLEQADNSIAQAEAQYRDAQIDLMVRVTEAYFKQGPLGGIGVLRAADLVRVQESLLRANERQLEQSRQRFEVGLVAITDVNESQAAYDRSRAELINAENNLNNSWEALRKIIGPVSVPLARLGDELPLAPPEPNDIDEWAKTAVQNNYRVVAALEAVEVAKQQIEIERSGHYPTVDLQAGYGLNRADRAYQGGINDDNQGFVGLTLNIPIYQGGAVTSRTRQAGYDLGAAQERLDQTRREVIEQVKNAFRGVLSSISDVQARQAAIVSARSALESTQAGLEVGTRTQVDVLNAQRNLFQAEFEYLSARYDYIINGVKLHQATSTLTRDVLAKGNAWLNPNDLVPPPSN